MAFPQDMIVTFFPCSAATRLMHFLPFLYHYKGLFVKAQSTSFLMDNINAFWFVHYSLFFHCRLKFCKVVINNEAVQILGYSRIKILHFAGCNHGITLQKNPLTKHDQPFLFLSQMDLEYCFSHSM